MSIPELSTLRSRATDQEALKERGRALLATAPVANGIRYVFVSLAGGVATLEVEFYNRKYLQAIIDKYNADPSTAPAIFKISGGHRLVAGPAVGQVQVKTITKSADFDAPKPTQPTTLVLTVQPIGDYSTYTLSINVGAFVAPNPIVMDPVFGDIDFKFRPGCFSGNCAPEWTPAGAPADEPVIDYLAKDYDSFRHTMISAMMQRVPDWQPSSEADLDEVLLDLFSAAADELSDYQDRVMNEAYLASARKRVSLARHARLMDYHIYQGNQASTWLTLQVKLPQPSEPQVGATRQYVLARNFKVWAGTTTEDESSIVFHSDAQQRVHQLVNRLSLYTWSDAIPSLSAGATSADLIILDANLQPVTDEASARVVETLIRSRIITRLLIEERLNPATGEANGFNPRHRQLLRLLPDGVKALSDPTPMPPLVAPAWFVRVRWDKRDELTSNYCFTVDGLDTGKVDNVSLLYGNIAEVRHGNLKEEVVFKEPGAILDPLKEEFHFQRVGRWDLRQDVFGKWGAICALSDHPLAYRETERGGVVPPQSTLSVSVKVPGGAQDTWDEVPSFVHSDDGDENGDHFMVETDEDRLSYIRFGNGSNGKELPRNAEVHCTYQVGDGPAGNVGLNKLVNFDNAAAAILTFVAGTATPPHDGTIDECWNPFDVTNGTAPEPAATIIRAVPEAYRARQLRAITLQDYVDRAKDLPGVSGASARYAWTGSWRTVQVTIDPVGTTELTPAARADIARHLDAVRLIGEDLEIRAPRFVPLEIHVSVCANGDYWPEDLKSILEQEFSVAWTPDGRKGFFHPDLWTFGQQLKASQIDGRILSVEGVEHMIAVTMRRWNGPATMSDEITNVASNEIIQVFNDRDHQELGFIDFVVQGGRR
jgi:hypothetical protein